nr:hypothetical protein [uncultured Draconibacterium sp.]
MTTLKEKIQNEIENGNLYAWNDGDGGLGEAIDCGNVTETYEEAKAELADELYNESNFTWQAQSFTKAEWYDHCCKDGYSDEACHTWIYDLKEYLEDM